MFESKYGKALTVLLIIAIIAIIGLLIFFGYRKIKNDNIDKDAVAVIEEFKRDHNIKDDEEPEGEKTPDVDNNQTFEIIDTIPSTNTSNNGSSTTNNNNKTYYKGFPVGGYIQIPKTKIKYPILEKVTIKSLEASVAILYPADAKLNEPGNVVIAGHNYRNQMFFSNNKKLVAGDKIYITDEKGRKLTYEVYDNFEAAAEDTSFYIRDTAGVPEITLTTCTKDSAKRTIILAKAVQ